MQTQLLTPKQIPIPAKRDSYQSYSIYIGVFIIALTCAAAGWLVRGLVVEQHETQELTVAVKTALDFARESQAKDQTIQRLSNYCAPGNGVPETLPSTTQARP